MKKQTKLKKQLEDCKEWAARSRHMIDKRYQYNDDQFTLLMMQISIEEIIKYLEMQEDD